MTSSHHGPYGQGYTRTTMVGTEGCKPATVSQSQKPHLSPDWSLQLDSMKSESLVIADQHCCGEYVTAATRRTLPGLDIHGTFQRWIGAFGNRETGAAWLSSARVVRCWVKSRNERNPCP